MWRAEGSTASIPWRELGSILFELGGEQAAVSITETGLTAYTEGSIDWSARAACACDLLAEQRMYEELDWDEDPVESYDNWQAAATQTGFKTIRSTGGRLTILPVQRYEPANTAAELQVSVLEGDGWGNGEHPTTKMCLDFLERAVTQGCSVIDYGTGSGVLSIAALKLGAASAIGVDIDEEVLAHAKQNLLLNGHPPLTSDAAVEAAAAAAPAAASGALLLHTRAVQTGSLQPADIVIANILVGPLRRLIAVLALAVAEGGLLALSGFRPSDRAVLELEYGEYIDFDSEYSDSGTHPVWGEWCLIAGHPRPGQRAAMRASIEASLSDMAVQ